MNPHIFTHMLGLIKAETYEFQGSNVQLKLTIVNTMGFGNQINKEESYQPRVDT